MVLESTMICLDNSDWMRNGDYAPTRLESQQDAAGLICNDRINSNPENTVGILTMAGTGVDMRVSPTEEAGKILACFSGITIGGKSDVSTAVQIAQLALKHRKNKNGGQRIIVFVGAPVAETVEKLQKIGKQLKKNNVAVDVISMGEVEENSEKLLEFVNATNSNDNSHLITVPAGVSPVNAIISSPIMHMGGGMGADGMGGGGGGAGGAGGDNFDMYGGIDPAMDPELAMAIRASTEEARAQEEARMKAQQEALAAEGGGASTAAAPSSSSASGGAFGGAAAVDEEDEDALMQRALEMSMMEMLSVQDAGAAGAVTAGQESKATEGDEDDEEAELARALQLSVASNPPAPGSGSAFADPSFASSLLSSADVNDPLIQAALAQMNAGANQPPPPPSKEDEKQDEAGKKRKGDDV